MYLYYIPIFWFCRKGQYPTLRYATPVAGEVYLRIFKDLYVCNNLFMNNISCTILRENLSPLSQFEIRDLINIDTPVLGNLHISLTNIGFYLTTGAFFLLVINLISTNYNKLVSNN